MLSSSSFISADLWHTTTIIMILHFQHITKRNYSCPKFSEGTGREAIIKISFWTVSLSHACETLLEKNMLRRLSWAAIAKWCLLCWRLRCHYCQPFPRACRSISLFHMFHLFLQNISFWISLDRYLYKNISSWSWGGLLILLPSHFKPQIQLWDYSLPPSPPWDTSSQKLKISHLPNGQLALFWCCCK